MKDFRVDYVPLKALINSAGTLTFGGGATVYLYSLLYNCTNAGTTFSLTIRDKTSPTPLVLYTIATLVVSTTPVVIVPPMDLPIPMSSGMDVITTGTPGAVNLFGAYAQD